MADVKPRDTVAEAPPASLTALGYVELETGRVVEINDPQEWGWITEGRARGAQFVISCADRFNMPADYYPVFVMPDEGLESAKHTVLAYDMQEILAVFRLKGDG